MFTIESGGVDCRGRHYVSGVFEELIHLVERNFPVHDNQVMPADLNNDHERASDDGDLICILWLF